MDALASEIWPFREGGEEEFSSAVRVEVKLPWILECQVGGRISSKGRVWMAASSLVEWGEADPDTRITPPFGEWNSACLMNIVPSGAVARLAVLI